MRLASARGRSRVGREAGNKKRQPLRAVHTPPSSTNRQTQPTCKSSQQRAQPGLPLPEYSPTVLPGAMPRWTMPEPTALRGVGQQCEALETGQLKQA